MADLIYDFHHQDKDVREVDIKTIERNVYVNYLAYSFFMFRFYSHMQKNRKQRESRHRMTLHSYPCHY